MHITSSSLYAWITAKAAGWEWSCCSTCWQAASLCSWRDQDQDVVQLHSHALIKLQLQQA